MDKFFWFFGKKTRSSGGRLLFVVGDNFSVGGQKNTKLGMAKGCSQTGEVCTQFVFAPRGRDLGARADRPGSCPTYLVEGRCLFEPTGSHTKDGWEDGAPKH